MNAIRCELCGSNEIVKTDGFFVCQHCGTKYTIEEAKQMLSGIVKIDNTDLVAKYLANAKRAMTKKDWEEVEKYYNLVEQNDPTNIEAIFYSSYGKARLSMIDGDIYKRQQTCNVFCNSISVIDDNYKIEESKNNKALILEMSSDLFDMYCTEYVYTQTTQNGNVVSDNKYETEYLFALMAIAFIESIDNIIKIDNQPEYKKIVYFHQKYLMTNTGIKLEARKFWYTRTLETASEIQEQDPLFEIPYIEEPAEKGGCYIATAVYGSYDCPQVWTLRHYRDYKLSKTFLGRVFIRTYYVISPILVKWFGNSAWFKNLWKRKLDGVIASLQNKGVESKSCDDFLDVNL